MNAFQSCEREKRCWCFILFILLSLYLLAFSIINFCGFPAFVDNDMYVESLVAKYMWNKKSLFPDGWVFGNQYHVFSTSSLASLFYGLTKSMNLSMALSTSFFTLALLAGMYWMLRPLFDQLVALSGVLALVSIGMNMGQRSDSWIFFVMCSYYSCYLLTSIIVWGDYTHTCFLNHKTSHIPLYLGLFLSFTMGMQSIRQTCIMVLPLLAFEGLRIAFILIRRHSPDWRPTLHVGLVTAANLAGYLLMQSLHIPANKIYGTLQIRPSDQLAQSLTTLKTSWIEITGLAYTNHLTTNTGRFIFLFSFACIAAVLLTLLLVVTRFWKGNAGAIDVLISLCVISLLAVSFSSILLTLNMRSVYLFMWYFLVCLSAAFLISTVNLNRRRIALIFLVFLSIGNLFCTYGKNVQKSLGPWQEAYVQAADALAAQGCEILYAPWYAYCGGLCSYTDGAVTMVLYNSDFQTNGYVCPQDLSRPEDNQRAAYLILNQHFEECLRVAEERGAVLTPLLESARYPLYISSAPIMVP